MGGQRLFLTTPLYNRSKQEGGQGEEKNKKKDLGKDTGLPNHGGSIPSPQRLLSVACHIFAGENLGLQTPAKRTQTPAGFGHRPFRPS